MSDVSRIEAIFLQALQHTDPDTRAAFLDRACGGNPETRRQVERLLQAHPAAGRYLEPPGAADETRSVALDPGPVAHRAGSVIGGRYKLLEPIGEGGMGSVWMAQQTEPVRRIVALKLIKAGMDTKAVLARFEAERQALALMDHPNIAKVLDAGATEEGRPFFVMELVKGVPITRYCDERKLSLRERLDLFIPVCQAVQHAHQKGVIHRDLKPSNVLVARYDDHPVPKVIDFGIAKAAGQPLTDRTLVTGFGAVVGTPEYMSPEQAQFNQLDVDTRSDIYALGVLLYELLTGSTPVTRGELEKAGLLEVLRMIRETEPPRPSTRLSTLEGLPLIAANRGSEPKTLAGLLKNDLDWIVMKSLEKDRNRRYETATGLAADVGRYLAGEAVQAHPPSTFYRLKKFRRKHRVAINTAALILGLLVGAVGMSTMLAVKARRAEAVAEANAKQARESSQLYQQSLEKEAEARAEAELSAIGSQIGLDEAEMNIDGSRSLLRMARSLRKRFEDEVINFPGVEQVGRREAASRGRLDRAKRVALDEFATLAILFHGQDWAPLLKPISPDVNLGTESFRISSTGRRFLAHKDDGSVNLWDPFSGRHIAELHRGDEETYESGFSPDGSTVFAGLPNGAIRLWNAEDGSLRAETEPRPGNIKIAVGQHRLGDTVVGNDRLMTSNHVVVGMGVRVGSWGPVELWDTSSGRSIAQLEFSQESGNFQLTIDGRWILASGGDDTTHVWDSINGRHVARLVDDDHKPETFNRALLLSPSGRTLAIVHGLNVKQSDSCETRVRLWDTSTWRLISRVGPIHADKNSSTDSYLIDDNYFLLYERYNSFRLYRAGMTQPVAELPGERLLVAAGGLLYIDSQWSLGDIHGPTIERLGHPIRSVQDRALFGNGLVYDSTTWRRFQPPTGRVYHPELSRFAPDGRFLFLDCLIDTVTENALVRKRSAAPDSGAYYLPGAGWVTTQSGPNYNHVLGIRLPPMECLKIPPALLELWAQVAVRGQLDEQGNFVKWDEPTWEKKRQELADQPAPYPDFPFPGHIAGDRLHWLRQEYQNAKESDQPALARKLLDRAEAIGDQAEASRWRKVVAPKPNQAH